jgi:hypothetical protein
VTHPRDEILLTALVDVVCGRTTGRAEIWTGARARLGHRARPFANCISARSRGVERGFAGRRPRAPPRKRRTIDVFYEDLVLTAGVPSAIGDLRLTKGICA